MLNERVVNNNYLEQSRITQCVWDFSVDARHPATYNPVSEASIATFITALRNAKAQNSLFLRKVKCEHLENIVRCWLQVVYDDADSCLVDRIVHSDVYSGSSCDSDNDSGMKDSRKRGRHE